MEKKIVLKPFSEESLEVLYALAHTHYNGGKFQEASDLFFLLTKQARDLRKGWMGYAASLQMLKRFDEAIAAYGWAAILDENDPYVHFYAAECFWAMENKDNALLALQSARNVAQASAKHSQLDEQLKLLESTWSQSA